MTQKDADQPHKTDGNSHGHGSADPLHKIPLLGEVVRQGDRLRHRLPLIGPHLTQADADVLRFEARMLRLAASRMEGRAQQLDRINEREKTDAPRRIQVE